MRGIDCWYYMKIVLNGSNLIFFQCWNRVGMAVNGLVSRTNARFWLHGYLVMSSSSATLFNGDIVSERRSRTHGNKLPFAPARTQMRPVRPDGSGADVRACRHGVQQHLADQCRHRLAAQRARQDGRADAAL